MHPQIAFGPFTNTWKLVVGIAIALTLPLSMYEGRRRGVPAGLVLRVWPAVVLGGFLGAHLYFLLTHPHYLDRRPVRDSLDLFTGLSVQGSVVGGAVAAALLLRLVDRPLLPFLDVLVPGMALGQAVGRLGCLAAGCCYGRPFPLGIVYTDALAPAPLNIPLHPAQLYEAALDACLAWVLHASLARGGEPAGKVFCRYLAGYAGIRFVVQFSRGDDAGHLVLGLAHSQYAAVVMALAALWLARRLESPQRNSSTSAPAATR